MGSSTFAVKISGEKRKNKIVCRYGRGGLLPSARVWLTERWIHYGIRPRSREYRFDRDVRARTQGQGGSGAAGVVLWVFCYSLPRCWGFCRWGHFRFGGVTWIRRARGNTSFCWVSGRTSGVHSVPFAKAREVIELKRRSTVPSAHVHDHRVLQRVYVPSAWRWEGDRTVIPKRGQGAQPPPARAWGEIIYLLPVSAPSAAWRTGRTTGWLCRPWSARWSSSRRSRRGTRTGWSGTERRHLPWTGGCR